MNEQEMRKEMRKEMQEVGDHYMIAEAKDIAHAIDLILDDRRTGEFAIGAVQLRILCEGFWAALKEIDRVNKLRVEGREAGE